MFQAPPRTGLCRRQVEAGPSGGPLVPVGARAAPEIVQMIKGEAGVVGINPHGLAVPLLGCPRQRNTRCRRRRLSSGMARVIADVPCRWKFSCSEGTPCSSGQIRRRFPPAIAVRRSGSGGSPL